MKPVSSFPPKKRASIPSFYAKIPVDKDGWADAEKHKPDLYDLVSMVVRRKEQGVEKNKIIPGWWNSRFWTGYRLKRSDVVKRWKREHPCRSSSRK